MTTAGATLTLFLILSLTLVHAREYRSIDGTGNNLVDPLLGAAGIFNLHASHIIPPIKASCPFFKPFAQNDPK